MFKLFNIGHHDEHHSDEIDVHHDHEGETLEEDVGQVALDVLDQDSAIVIVAPLAGIAIDAIDVAVSRNVLTIS